MKVGTRITVATAVVVALASAVYAVFDLRAHAAERHAAFEREARAVASTLRANLEAPAAAWRPPSDAQQRELARASGWKVVVIPRARVADADSDSLPLTEKRQLRWLKVLVDVPARSFDDIDGDNYVYAVSLLSRSPSGDEPSVLAMLEIAHPADALALGFDDYARAFALVALIVVATTVVVGALANRLVGRPITKLLTGIDDVAKGDLSHVILSERDDEIGQIATRFNEMTFSLRESRAETQRQNEDKLALEQRLGQTEKLATIGQLAAEIAHEVGTPLNVIAGRARSIQRKAKTDVEAVEKNAAIVAEQTARITRIIQRLLDFTRRKVGATGKVDVNINELHAHDHGATRVPAVGGARQDAPRPRRRPAARIGRRRPPAAGADQSAAERDAGHARGRRARGRDSRGPPHPPRPRRWRRAGLRRGGRAR